MPARTHLLQQRQGHHMGSWLRWCSSRSSQRTPASFQHLAPSHTPLTPTHHPHRTHTCTASARHLRSLRWCTHPGWHSAGGGRAGAPWPAAAGQEHQGSAPPCSLPVHAGRWNCCRAPRAQWQPPHLLLAAAQRLVPGLHLVPPPPPDQQVVQLHRLQALAAQPHTHQLVRVSAIPVCSSPINRAAQRRAAPACQTRGGQRRAGRRAGAPQPLLQLLLPQLQRLHPRLHPRPAPARRRVPHRLRRLRVQQLVPQRARHKVRPLAAGRASGAGAGAGQGLPRSAASGRWWRWQAWAMGQAWWAGRRPAPPPPPRSPQVEELSLGRQRHLPCLQRPQARRHPEQAALAAPVGSHDQHAAGGEWQADGEGGCRDGARQAGP